MLQCNAVYHNMVVGRLYYAPSLSILEQKQIWEIRFPNPQPQTLPAGFLTPYGPWVRVAGSQSMGPRSRVPGPNRHGSKIDPGHCKHKYTATYVVLANNLNTWQV